MMKSIFSPFKTISPNGFSFLMALYFFCGLNFVLIEKLYTIYQSTQGLGLWFWISVPVFFISAFTFLFIPFTSKYIAKPFFIFLVLFSAGVNYGMSNFGIVFNADMMQNILETTPAEAGSYSNAKTFIWFGLSGLLPVFYIAFVKIEYKPFVKEIIAKSIALIVCLVLIASIAGVYYKDYASIARNNDKLAKNIIPTYPLSGLFKYIKNTYFTPPLPYQTIGEDALRKDEEEKYLVVFIVGETARAQNYQWNGYNRPTNAYTKEIDNVVSFQNTRSCGTATAVSLPCMFSLLKKDHYSQRQFDAQDNVVDIVNRAGIKTIWLDNNTGCKGVCRHIENNSTTKMIELNCIGEECNDSVFLDIFDQQIDNLNGEDGLVFLHLIGSHGPTYYKRYPREHAKFQPDCQTSDLQKCSDEEIINAYDNTILFTDYVMAELIKKLKKYDDHYKTALVYMSDHGESLGEGGVYLHGMPYAVAPEYQTHVPFMMWMSDEMMEHKKIDMFCLRNIAKNNNYSHDNLSPTILKLMDVKTEAYEQGMDVLKDCVGEK